MTYAAYIEFTPAEGQGDALLTALQEAAAQMATVVSCRHYLVGKNVASGAIGVWEVWTSKEAHDGSLQDPATRAFITRTMPLIAGFTGPFELELGSGTTAGKGLAPLLAPLEE
jgi:quinol monooxygenase YgiN